MFFDWFHFFKESFTPILKLSPIWRRYFQTSLFWAPFLQPPKRPRHRHRQLIWEATLPQWPGYSLDAKAHSPEARPTEFFFKWQGWVVLLMVQESGNHQLIWRRSPNFSHRGFIRCSHPKNKKRLSWIWFVGFFDGERDFMGFISP